jgi:hypothetical protein
MALSPSDVYACGTNPVYGIYYINIVSFCNLGLRKGFGNVTFSISKRATKPKKKVAPQNPKSNGKLLVHGGML